MSLVVFVREIVGATDESRHVSDFLNPTSPARIVSSFFVAIRIKIILKIIYSVLRFFLTKLVRFVEFLLPVMKFYKKLASTSETTNSFFHSKKIDPLSILKKSRR